MHGLRSDACFAAFQSLWVHVRVVDVIAVFGDFAARCPLRLAPLLAVFDRAAARAKHRVAARGPILNSEQLLSLT